MFLSFVVLIFNSVVLYIAPEGRIAYWADWRFWGLTKNQWGDQHITIGFLFLAAGLLHLFYNWNPILTYLKNKVRKLKIFTLSFNIALIVTAIFVIGTYYPFPPMSTILHVNESFKQAGAKKYGEPPYGHAELSTLKLFSKKENLDLKQILALLKAAGFTTVAETNTIKGLARRHDLTPQQVYEIIKTAQRNSDSANGIKRANTFPDVPPPGFGRKTLESFCLENNLNLENIIGKLAEQGLKVKGGVTMKENASANGKTPMELFESIKANANTTPPGQK